MSDYETLISALERLHTAVGTVERAVSIRDASSNDVRIQNLQAELARLNQDRALMGDEIDRLNAHARTLEITNADVAERLDKAIESIKTVLEPE